MSVNLCLSSIKKDSRIIESIDDEIMKINLDVFFELIEKDNSINTDEVGYLYSFYLLSDLLEKDDLLAEIGIVDNFNIYENAGNFSNGEGLDMFYNPKNVLDTFIKIKNNRDLVCKKIESWEEFNWEELDLAIKFTEESIAKDRYVRFHYEQMISILVDIKSIELKLNDTLHNNG